MGKPTPHKKKPKQAFKFPGPKKSRNQFLGRIINIILLIVFFTLLFDILFNRGEEDKMLSITEVVNLVQTEQVEQVVVRGDKLELILLDETEKISKKESQVSFSELMLDYGVTPETLATIDVEVQDETGFWYWVLTLLPFIFPLLILGLFLWFFLRQSRGVGMKAFSFGDSRARLIDPADKRNRITFKDVAGNIEAKNELEEIVDFLKNPKKFLQIGAKIPKGVLLRGAPGTGKTLLARAVAGEAQVPFFYLSGSEFVEMFVGVGASRVRDLFVNAKRVAPAIIFIDEIDAVGRSRGVGIGGGNDEREQTLNQILVEMDGFDPHEKVIVMAATNRADVLDPALLRPGRFDRRVTLELPDRGDREKILHIHTTGKPLTDEVNLKVIAERTPGFSGADLESLMNEAAILAARRDKKKIDQKDLIDSIEKVMIGPERKSHLFTEEEKKITAYHEAGHAIVSSVLPNADPVHKVSIVARGHAGGFTMKLPLEERKIPSRAMFLDDIAMGLGGYMAEMKKFGDITTGPAQDLRVITSLARDMVTRYGMSDEIGPLAIEGRPRRGMEIYGIEDSSLSDEVSAQVDREVSRIIKDAMKRAATVIDDHAEAFEEIAKTLLEKETLEQEEYNKILEAHGIVVKEKK